MSTIINDISANISIIKAEISVIKERINVLERKETDRMNEIQRIENERKIVVEKIKLAEMEKIAEKTLEIESKQRELVNAIKDTLEHAGITDTVLTKRIQRTSRNGKSLVHLKPIITEQQLCDKYIRPKTGHYNVYCPKSLTNKTPNVVQKHVETYDEAQSIFWMAYKQLS